MAVPKFVEMYRPFVDCLKDGKVHRFRDLKDEIAFIMKITEEDRKELLSSGQAKFDNRVGWASSSLKYAGLIESPSRGHFKLTEEGFRVLKENPPVLNDTYLNRYESFRKFLHPDMISPSSDTQFIKIITEETPQDTLEKAVRQINSSLSDDLLSEIMKQTPAFFEVLVVRLLEKMGYGGSLKDAGLVTGKTGDEGIDGIIREDKLGFNLIYIQAKRWDINSTIGGSDIQKFVGALAGQGATKGLFITTAQFSKAAIEYAKKQHMTKVILVNGTELAQLMINHNLGVSVEIVYEVKKIDTDFFIDEDN